MAVFPEVTIIGLKGLPIISVGHDLGKLIASVAKENGIEIRDGDILVVSHTIVAKSEGCVVDMDDVSPSEFAKTISTQTGKDPRHVEVILRNTKSIVRMRDEILVCETPHGFVCANAGVDVSNVGGDTKLATLPPDPDESARNIRRGIAEQTGRDVAVIVSDTHGRPFRKGTINVAIGCSGINPLWDRRGEVDLYGRVLRSKITCVADELCSAAELVIGQSAESVPVAIIRGYRYQRGDNSAKEICRPPEEDLFR